MRTRSALAVVAMGFSLWSCSEEKAGPGVGPDTSWQIFCSDDDPDMDCNVSEKPHGPLDGLKKDDPNDDYSFNVSCSKPSSGYTIKIEDPGNDEDVGKQLPERPRSVITISRADAEENKCTVEVLENPLSGGQRRFIDHCAGNGSNPGTCTLEEAEGDGYAFSATLICEGMRNNGNGPPVYVLRKATKQNDPVLIQIASCD